jgi:oligogalacturonide transporter
MNETLRKPTTKNAISYGVGDLYGGGAFFIIGALFLVFLRDVVGLSGTLAGTVVLVGKIWDAISDPTMGYISDNTRSKHGRRRLYFLIGIAPIFFSWLLLWTNFDFTNEIVKFLYYLLVYLLFNTVFTLVMVPYNSMPAEMAREYKDRSKLVTIRMLFSQTGMLLGAVLPLTIINLFDVPSTGYLVMGTFFSILFTIPWIFVYKGTYELEDYDQNKQQKSFGQVLKKIGRDFASTTNNKSLRIHITMYICAYVAMDVFNALLIFYIRDYMNLLPYYQVLLGIVVIFQMLSLFVVMKECNLFGNAKTYRIHASIWLLAILTLFAIGNTIPAFVVLAVGIVIGFGLSGCVMTPYNMLAFVIDADEIITTKKRQGTYAGMMTFLRKIAQAIALFLVGVGLDVVQYQEPINDVVQTQTSSTLLGIRLMFAMVPVLLLLIGIIFSFRFKITPEKHAILIQEIDRLKAGGEKANADSTTKQVCEEITGITYEKLWDIGFDND